PGAGARRGRLVRGLLRRGGAGGVRRPRSRAGRRRRSPRRPRQRAAPGAAPQQALRSVAIASRADQIRLTELDSGLRVLTERMPDVRSVTIGFWVAAGSRDEEPRLAGVSHFLEHLLFKGTDTRTAKEIADAVDAVGGEMNAFTTKEYTAFYTRLVDLDVDLGLDILSDIMWAPAFRPDEIEAERQVILEEILMHEDDPADLVHDVLHEAMFPEHPLGRQVLGDAQTISAMTRDEIHGYWASCYRPAN